jgi:hypothetical protein
VFLDHHQFQPKGIVYVIDCSLDPKEFRENVREFDHWMKYFYTDRTKKNLPLATPVLILANKADMNPNFEIRSIEKIYNPKKYKFNYKIYMTSTITGDGLFTAFKWLVNQIKYATQPAPFTT